MSQRHRAWAEINTSAVQHNLGVIRNRAKSADVMAILKANAYSHGAVKMAQFLVQQGVNAIGVGDSGEAIELREAGITCPILIVGGIIPGEAQAVVEHDIAVNLHTVEMAIELDRVAGEIGKQAEVHLKIDTGMGRLGMQPFDAVPFLHNLRSLKNLRLTGMCTHFSSPGESSPSYTSQQLELFHLAVEVAHRLGYENLKMHTASSLAFFGRDDSEFNMVRTGIALWGYLPGRDESDLQPAMQFKTRVLFLKDVPEGAPIGYSRTWYAPHPTRIATLPIGYNDGYPTALSNNADVYINGQRCPVVGRVSMDYATVDVGHLGEISVGDEVELMGENIDLYEVSNNANMIPYEFLCGIGKRVVREYL
ncbi:alanine racemase [Planctomycetota bacterium]|nr:alanine racemase [Planctomycetota bacterium]